MEWGPAAEKIDRFLATFIANAAMDLTYVIETGGEGDGLRARFAGADAGLLVARNAEVLLALEGVATGVLRLTPEQHDLISFDAEDYKVRRLRHLQRAAHVAVSKVRATGEAYTFPPMSSRERRMLHLELMNSGLRSASSGEGGRRFVVLYPQVPSTREAEDETSRPAADGRANRTQTIRSAFRPR